MRSKKILSIAVFIFAFVFSTALASLFIDKSVYPTFTTYSGYEQRSYNSSRSYCDRTQYQSETARSISSVLRQDDANGKDRGRKLYNIGTTSAPAFSSEAFPDFAEAIEEYVDLSSNLETNNLPSDFQKSWNSHIKAWRDYSDFLNKMSNAPVRKKYTSEELIMLEKQHSMEISVTWNEVLKIGGKYGARIN